MAAAAGILAKVGSFLGSPGFSAGLSSAGTFLSGLGQTFGWGRPSLSAQLDVSQRLAKYEHDLSMDAWREQVAYNDPARQAERLEAAGYSRHNLVGNASIAGNASGVPAASVDTPDLSKFQKGLNLEGLGRALSSFSDVQIALESLNKLRLENENIKANTNLTKEDSLLRQRQQELARQQTLQSQRQMLRDDTMFKYDLEYKKRMISQIDQSIIESNKRLTKLDEEINILRTQVEIENIKLNDFWKQKIEPGSGFSDRILKEIYEKIKAKIKEGSNKNSNNSQTEEDFNTLWQELINGVNGITWRDFTTLIGNFLPFGAQLVRQVVKQKQRNIIKGYINWDMP